MKISCSEFECILTLPLYSKTLLIILYNPYTLLSFLLYTPHKIASTSSLQYKSEAIVFKNPHPKSETEMYIFLAEYFACKVVNEKL